MRIRKQLNQQFEMAFPVRCVLNIQLNRQQLKHQNIGMAKLMVFVAEVAVQTFSYYDLSQVKSVYE